MAGKKTGKKLSIPREMTEINKDYQKLCFDAGQAQYQSNYWKTETDKINARLLAVNNEAANRKALDNMAKQAAPEEAPTQTAGA